MRVNAGPVAATPRSPVPTALRLTVPTGPRADAAAPPDPMSRAFADLHTHSKGSFDSLASPKDMVKAAADRGLTHLAITDHDRIDVAQEARALSQTAVTVIVGEEVKTRDGDLICLFLERAIPPGLSAMETIAAAREQGGLVGHPAPVRQDARVAPA